MRKSDFRFFWKYDFASIFQKDDALLVALGQEHGAQHAQRYVYVLMVECMWHVQQHDHEPILVHEHGVELVHERELELVHEHELETMNNKFV